MKKMLLVAFTLVLASCGTPSEPAEVEVVEEVQVVDSTAVEVEPIVTSEELEK